MHAATSNGNGRVKKWAILRTAAAWTAIEWCCKDTYLAPNKQALICSNSKNSYSDHFDAFALNSDA